MPADTAAGVIEPSPVPWLRICTHCGPYTAVIPHDSHVAALALSTQSEMSSGRVQGPRWDCMLAALAVGPYLAEQRHKSSCKCIIPTGCNGVVELAHHTLKSDAIGSIQVAIEDLSRSQPASSCAFADEDIHFGLH